MKSKFLKSSKIPKNRIPRNDQNTKKHNKQNIVEKTPSCVLL